MKTSIYFSALVLNIIGMVINPAIADTLDSLLNDVQNDVLVIEKTASCSNNPYRLTSANHHLVASCKPAIAQCPSGATRMPGISKCSLVPSPKDAEILDLLKNTRGNWVSSLGEPFVSNKINEDTLNCQADGYKFGGFYGAGEGYTPFCFFDLSKVETIPPGGQQYAVPNWIDGNLIHMSNGSTITRFELNNANNYKCYSVQIKSTVRCLTLPSGFLKKLGLK